MADATESSVAGEEAFCLQIRLQKLAQLFNSLDPAPFHEKDLDPAAEEYIVESVDEHPLSSPMRLLIELPASERRHGGEKTVATAIHNYFTYQRTMAKRRLRFQFRQGRAALLVGIAFLLTCLAVRQAAVSVLLGPFGQLMDEGLLIIGWVAMWRPLEIFLYDWWPVLHRARLYAKLSGIPVDLEFVSD